MNQADSTSQQPIDGTGLSEPGFLHGLVSRIIYPLVLLAIVGTIWVVAWSQSLQAQVNAPAHRTLMMDPDAGSSADGSAIQPK